MHEHTHDLTKVHFVKYLQHAPEGSCHESPLQATRQVIVDLFCANLKTNLLSMAYELDVDSNYLLYDDTIEHMIYTTIFVANLAK
jgi:hypothetical protein